MRQESSMGSSGSWKKVKSKLWTYGDQSEVVKLVIHHLTHSANHMMTDEEAHATVIAHLEAYPESMTQGTEDFDQREAYRRWTGAIRGGGTTASAAKAATNDYLSSLEQLGSVLCGVRRPVNHPLLWRLTMSFS